jgi:Ca2+-binding RTX toxin-like protein
MAIFDRTFNAFRLADDETDFTIPATLPGSTEATPANTGIFGNALVNRLTGDATANLLDGGGGADWLSGGDGNDTYVVDNQGDVVVEDGPNGYDTVLTSVSFSIEATAVVRLEAISGFLALNLTGNHELNTIIGNDGANVIDGKTGVDRMEGKGGNDTYFVDHSGDAVVETAKGGTADQVFAWFDHRLDNHVENLTALGSKAKLLVGNSLKNVVTGAAGANMIDGKSGNDVLSGGKGRDTFVFSSKLGTSKTDRKVNFDSVKDFHVKDDTIGLSIEIFKKLVEPSKAPGKINKDFFTIGNKAKDTDDFIVYNKATGILSYDADGSGGKAAIEFAKLKAGLALTADDFRLF